MDEFLGLSNFLAGKGLVNIGMLITMLSMRKLNNCQLTNSDKVILLTIRVTYISVSFLCLKRDKETYLK